MKTLLAIILAPIGFIIALGIAKSGRDGLAYVIAMFFLFCVLPLVAKWKEAQKANSADNAEWLKAHTRKR
jgi:hypothetical protein